MMGNWRGGFFLGLFNSQDSVLTSVSLSFYYLKAIRILAFSAQSQDGYMNMGLENKSCFEAAFKKDSRGVNIM